jgi:hypothetical protein
MLEHVEADDRVDRPHRLVREAGQVEELEGDVRPAAEARAQMLQIGGVVIGEDQWIAAVDQEARHHADAAADLEQRAAEVGRDEVVGPLVVAPHGAVEHQQVIDQHPIDFADRRRGGLHPEIQLYASGRRRANTIIFVNGLR